MKRAAERAVYQETVSVPGKHKVTLFQVLPELPLGLLVIIFLAPIWAQFPIAVCRLTTGHQTANVPIFETPWTERVMGQEWWQCSRHCP